MTFAASAAPASSWITHRVPIGEILLSANDDGLCELRLPGDFEHREGSSASSKASVHLAGAVAQLDAYFAGELKNFELALVPRGTPFQLRVWQALVDIPYAKTESYGSVAARTGNPKACRAVGLANGRNPISIVVPCHRVIGSTGALVGYGGGLEMKQWLLQHEAAVAERTKS
ncbi:MAG: methylated-DNA--[protein]-cysteine S-methyltransferase [Acidimicrobiales bacterium]|jgi:methylated-DNA-[protein]-cysteine S-methyltransferase